MLLDAVLSELHLKFPKVPFGELFEVFVHFGHDIRKTTTFLSTYPPHRVSTELESLRFPFTTRPHHEVFTLPPNGADPWTSPRFQKIRKSRRRRSRSTSRSSDLFVSDFHFKRTLPGSSDAASSVPSSDSASLIRPQPLPAEAEAPQIEEPSAPHRPRRRGVFLTEYVAIQLREKHNIDLPAEKVSALLEQHDYEVNAVMASVLNCKPENVVVPGRGRRRQVSPPPQTRGIKAAVAGNLFRQPSNALRSAGDATSSRGGEEDAASSSASNSWVVVDSSSGCAASVSSSSCAAAESTVSEDVSVVGQSPRGEPKRRSRQPHARRSEFIVRQRNPSIVKPKGLSQRRRDQSTQQSTLPSNLSALNLDHKSTPETRHPPRGARSLSPLPEMPLFPFFSDATRRGRWGNGHPTGSARDSAPLTTLWKLHGLQRLFRNSPYVTDELVLAALRVSAGDFEKALARLMKEVPAAAPAERERTPVAVSGKGRKAPDPVERPKPREVATAAVVNALRALYPNLEAEVVKCVVRHVLHGGPVISGREAAEVRVSTLGDTGVLSSAAQSCDAGQAETAEGDLGEMLEDWTFLPAAAVGCDDEEKKPPSSADGGMDPDTARLFRSADVQLNEIFLGFRNPSLPFSEHPKPDRPSAAAVSPAETTPEVSSPVRRLAQSVYPPVDLEVSAVHRSLSQIVSDSRSSRRGKLLSALDAENSDGLASADEDGPEGVPAESNAVPFVYTPFLTSGLGPQTIAQLRRTHEFYVKQRSVLLSESSTWSSVAGSYARNRGQMEMTVAKWRAAATILLGNNPWLAADFRTFAGCAEEECLRVPLPLLQGTGGMLLTSLLRNTAENMKSRLPWFEELSGPQNGAASAARLQQHELLHGGERTLKPVAPPGASAFERDTGVQKELILDLHGLLTDEATRFTKWRLANLARRINGGEKSLVNGYVTGLGGAPVHVLHVVTGVGKHSGPSGGKLGAAVKKLAADEGYLYRAGRSGVLLVKIC